MNTGPDSVREQVSRIDLQPLGGIAGDMFAACMFDAYPELLPAFEADIDTLGITGITCSVERRLAHGLTALHFNVTDTAKVKPPRTLPAVVNFLEQSSLPTKLISCAIEIYTLLAKAEAAVHGKTPDTIHFHEVSDWDSMIDIIAAAGAITRVACKHWRIGPLPLGSGTVDTAHGAIPLPAPATVELLKGYAWKDDGQPGERVTPTGAAIVAFLKPESIQQMPGEAHLVAIGNGCGTRELADRANILRASIFAETEQKLGDIVCRLEFDIDDMTAEELAAACELLREREGVIDLVNVSLLGKKGRHATEVRMLVHPQFASTIIDDCFSLTTTLGVRTSEVQRRLLEREEKLVDGHRVKIAHRPNGVLTAKAESDSLSITGSLQQRRRLAERLQDESTDE